MSEQVYGYSPEEHEFSVPVPALSSGDLPVVIHVSAHGGGTVGKFYADNGWDYLVTVSGRPVVEGSDLRSGGMPKCHADMVRVAAEVLAAHGEMLAGGDTPAGEYTAEAAEFLAGAHERLSVFAADLTPGVR